MNRFSTVSVPPLFLFFLFHFKKLFLVMLIGMLPYLSVFYNKGDILKLLFCYCFIYFIMHIFYNRQTIENTVNIFYFIFTVQAYQNKCMPFYKLELELPPLVEKAHTRCRNNFTSFLD